MPPKQSKRRLTPQTLTLDGVTQINLPLDEAMTALHLHVEGTYDVAGGAATEHEDSHAHLFTRIEHEITGHKLFDADGFFARVVADHEWRGGAVDLALATGVAAGIVWRQVISLPLYMPHVRNPFITGLDPRGYSEHKVVLTAQNVDDVLGANASNLSATVTPVVEVLPGAPSLVGRVGMRRQHSIESPAGTSRTVDLKSDGVLDRLIVIARTAAGARSDALISAMRLVVNGQERRIDELSGYQCSALASRSQGTAAPVGVHILELDPDDYQAPENLVNAAGVTSLQLIITTANSDDDIKVLPHFRRRVVVAA